MNKEAKNPFYRELSLFVIEQMRETVLRLSESRRVQTSMSKNTAPMLQAEVNQVEQVYRG